MQFVKWNIPKTSRNNATVLSNSYYGGSTAIYGGSSSTGSSNGGGTYVDFNTNQSITGVKNFENGIAFGSPFVDAAGDFVFGLVDSSTYPGGTFKYDASTDMLVSTLPISAPNIGGSVYLYSQIDNSLGLTDISTGGYFNAYTTQKIHKRLYAAEQITNCFEFDTTLNAVKCKFPLYSVSWVSAGGANNSTPSSSSGSVTVHSWSDIGDYFSDDNTTATFNAYSIQKIYQMIQSTGATTITYDDVVDALGFTPADSSAVVENLTAEDISTALGYIPADASNVQSTLTASDISAILGYIPANADDLGGDLTASDISTALGYIPANAADIGGDLTADDIYEALGYLPYNSTNPAGYLTESNFKTINNQSIIGSGNINIQFDTTAIDGVINDVSARVAVNTSNINDISTRLFGANNGLSDKIDDISAKINDVSARVAQNATNIASNTTKINNVSARVGNISGNISDISARVAQNAASITNLGNQITGINTKITDISTRLYAMESNPLWEHFHYDAARNAVYTDTNFYSMGWSSAGGIRAESSSGSGSGSVTVHSWNDISDYYSDENTTATFNAYTIQRIYQMAQTAGSVQSIGYNDVIDALGYTPADSSAVQNLTASDISTALGYIPADASTVTTNITSAAIVNALGFTPYNASNPAGYVTSNDLSVYITTNDLSSFITDGDISSLASKNYVDNAVSGLKTYVDASIARIDSSLNAIDSSLDAMDSSITSIMNTIGTTTGSISEHLSVIDSSISGIYTDIQNLDTSLNTFIAAADASINLLLGKQPVVYLEDLDSYQLNALATKLYNSTTTGHTASEYDIPVMYANDKLVYYWKNGAVNGIINLYSFESTLQGGVVVTTGYQYKIDGPNGTFTLERTWNVGGASGEYDASINALDASIRYLDTSLGHLRGWVSRNDASLMAINTTVSQHDTSITRLDSSVSAISQWITTAGTPSVNLLTLSNNDAAALYTEMVTAAVNNTYYDKIIYIGDKYVYEWNYIPQADSNWMPDESYSSAVDHIVLNTFADYNNRVRRETFRWIGDTSIYTAGQSPVFAYLSDVSSGGNDANVVYYNTSTDQLNYKDASGNAYAVGSYSIQQTLGYKPDNENWALHYNPLNSVNGKHIWYMNGTAQYIDASDLIGYVPLDASGVKTINNQSIVGSGNINITGGIPTTYVSNIWVGTSAQLAQLTRDVSTLYITTD